MGEKSRGTALAEVFILIALVAIISSLIFIKYRNINEQQDMERAVNIFETTVHKYTAKSMISKKSYDIYFDYNNKSVTVKERLKDKILEKKNLPENLLYATPYDNQTRKDIDFHTTENGNLSKSFSVYIFNYSDTAQYRVSFYTFQQSRILRINIYKNINAGNIKYEEILNYHEKVKENEMREGWRKE